MRIGVDMQNVADIRDALAAHGDRYRRRVYTAQEVADSGGWGADAAVGATTLAGRFAAKEAVLKALRVTDDVPAWTDIEVVRRPGGWPQLRLHGAAARLASAAGLARFEVSISHDGDRAIAVVLLGAGPPSSDMSSAPIG